jgi:hypothetical protein
LGTPPVVPDWWRRFIFCNFVDMLADPVRYIRIISIIAGLLGGLIFWSIYWPIMALVVIGMFELAAIADERSRARRLIERELDERMQEERRDKRLRDKGLL